MFLLLLINPVKAEVDPSYTHNMFNHMSINPAFAGSNEMINLTSLYRNQWFGMPGAPETFLFSANTPFTLFEKSHGVGITILQDQIALTTDLNIRLAYSYRFKVGDGMLGIGANFGFINHNLDASGFNTFADANDVMTLKDNDSAIPSSGDNQKIKALDVGIGVFYNTEKLYFGLSSTHLNAPELSYDRGKSKKDRIFYATSGYNYQLSNPLYEIAPSFLIQTEGRIMQFNLNTNIIYNNRVWGGLSVRLGESIAGIFGTELISGLKFGYSYDFILNKIGLKTRSTHEVVINYSFKLKKERLPQRYKSIRFL